MTGYSRLNVLTRLTIGFVALFVVTMSVSVYSIIKLNQFNKATTYMLDVGDRMIECKERLGNALLSEVSYEKKYVISRDYALYNHFVSAGRDFNKYLNEAAAIADTLGSKEILDNIIRQHSHFKTLVEEEEKHFKSRNAYNSGWYKAEKEKTVEAIIEEIKNLELYIEDDTKNRIEGLAETGAKALRVALVMAIFSLISGIFIASGITRSITKPLSAMKRKTQEISEGNFKNPLNLSSPPEIEELANAFNLMCDKLNEMDKIKSDFFSSMAHELRTPLSSIKAGINLLEKNVNNPETGTGERVLAIVSEECNRLIRLVNALLDLSRMEAGMIDFDFLSGEVKPLISKAIAEVEPLSMARKISVDFDASEKCPAIMMDSERILQVVRNLLGNAVKFTPEEGSVNVFLKPVSGGLEISVADSGPGIPEEDRNMIFDKYKQAQTSVKTGIKGTGLGLAIAKHIVDAHGGRIWIENTSGRGSIFTVFLPV